MRVEGDLLLLATSGVHQRVGVQVSSLRVDVADGHSAAQNDVGGDILHLLGVEGSLELGAHKAVALAGVDEADEVDGKHGKIEGHGDHNEGEDAGHEVLEPTALSALLAERPRGAGEIKSLTIETFLESPRRTQS